MQIVGVDPSTKLPAYCILSVNKAGSVHIIEYSKPAKFIMPIWYKIAVGADMLFIEGQYMFKNYQSVKKLTFSAGEISGIFKLAGAHVEIVPPSTWQVMILGCKRTAKRDERKRMSCIAASDITKHKITDADIADAVCIAYWGAKTLAK